MPLQTKGTFDFANDLTDGVAPIIKLTPQFTLLQLMMAVTLAAILLGMATSDFSNGWNRPTCRVSSLAFSPNGKRLAIVSHRSDYPGPWSQPYVHRCQQMGILDLATASLGAIIDDERWREEYPASEKCEAFIAFGPGGETVLSQYDRIHPTIAVVGTTRVNGPSGGFCSLPGARAVRLAITPDGMHACLATLTDLPCLLSLSSCHLTGETFSLGTLVEAPAQRIESLTIFSGESQNALHRLTLSGDGKLVAIANPTRIDVRRTADRSSVAELVLPREHGQLSMTAFSPDGKTLVVSAEKAILLYDLASKQERELFRGDGLGPMALAPDGKTVVIGQGSHLCQMDVASGQVVRTLQGSAEVASVAYCPTGDTVAVGDAQGYVTLWDPATGRRLWRVAAPGCPGVSWIYSAGALGFWLVACGWLWIRRRRRNRVSLAPQMKEKTDPTSGRGMIS